MIRFFAVILVVIFYLMAFYQDFMFDVKKARASLSDEQHSRHIQHSINELAVDTDTLPLFREDFINRETQGIISHVSSISPTGKGRMGAVWYSGSKELAFDVAVYFSTYDETVGAWDEPKVLVNKETSSKELGRFVRKIGNPLLFRDHKGNLWLFYASLIANGWSGSSIAYKVSHDNGQTWTNSKKMLLSPFFNLSNNVKNNGIILHHDTFLLPIYHEFIYKYPQMVYITTSDEGIKYEVHKMTEQNDLIQPSVIREKDRGLVSFFRNTDNINNRFILAAKSEDNGTTWGTAVKTPLPNPNSGFDVIKLNNGSYVAIINNSFEDRSNLSLVISHDMGMSWRVLKVLEEGPKKEYSYPSISRSLNGLFHATYTYEKRRIKHIVFNEEWIESLEDRKS